MRLQIWAFILLSITSPFYIDKLPIFWGVIIAIIIVCFVIFMIAMSEEDRDKSNDENLF